MAMNRQTRRLLQRQGEVGADGTPTRSRTTQTAPRPAPAEERTGLLRFLSESRAELRRVVWPTRSELINYSLVVLVAIVLLTALIAGLDWLSGESIFRLYDV
jgi:preprotein translocase subunit SecE